MRRVPLLVIAPLLLAALTAAAAEATPDLEARLRDLWGRGEEALARGSLDQAQDILQEALTLDPNRGRTWNYLGHLSFARAAYPEALARFRRAGELDPLDPRIRNNLGTVSERLDLIPEAVEHYLAAIELAPDYPVPYRNLGAVYANRIRDRALAVKYWSAFLRLAPDDPDRDRILAELDALKGSGPH
jgi:tetratricopeptide (TPR) repeat protein